jgi:antitoxin protein of toxin-antitoxin system
MGISDSFRDMADKAKDKIGSERAEQGVDAAGDKLDEATDNKYEGQVDRGQEAVRNYLNDDES